MISKLSDPIELNNVGVRNLESNDITSACEQLTRAVKLVLRTQNTTSSRKSLKLRGMQSNKCISFRWSKDTPLSKSKDETQTGTYTFSRGMLVYETSKTKYDARCTLSSDVMAAICYNAGLAFHHAATRRNESLLLKKALTMYQLSQTILRRANRRDAKSRLCHSFFFHVALLNNLGQLSYELVDYQASRYYFGHLESNVRFLVSKASSIKSSPKEGTTYSPENLIGMMSNAIIAMPNAAPVA